MFFPLCQGPFPSLNVSDARRKKGIFHYLIDRQTPQLAVPEATILTTLFPALLFRFRLPCTLKTGETLPNCSKMRRG